MLNSRGTVLFNIHQSLLLCAHKFLSYVSEAFLRHNSINMKFLESVILRVIDYQYRLVQSRSPVTANLEHTPISKQEVQIMGNHAFSTVLKTKQPKFDSLIHSLQQQSIKNISKKNLFDIDNLNGNVL